MKTILVLPVYNEEKYIADLVARARPYVDKIIVVDDGSQDDSLAQAHQAGAIALPHIVNLGKAAALKTGCEAAIRQRADIIILMDSDGQHLPADLPRFIDPLRRDEVDIVIGSRTGGDKMPFIRNYGNRLLEIITKLLFHVKIRDIQSGYRAFRSNVYPLLRWHSKNYHADAEMTVRVGRYNLRYQEIPIQTIYHDVYKGMTIFDGLSLLNKLFIWKCIL